MGEQVFGRDHGDDAVQEVWVLFKKLCYFGLDSPFELFSVCLGYCIPHLSLSVVCIVHGREHQVLIVPAEGRVAHANIQPRNVYATDVLAPRELHEGVAPRWDVIEVPGVVQVFGLAGVDDWLARTSEARAILVDPHIGCILDLVRRAGPMLHHVPITFLDGVVVFFRLLLSGHFFEFTERVPLKILVKRLALTQLLQHLVPSGKPLLRLPIEGHWRLKAGRWDNLNAAERVCILLANQLLNIEDWVAELFLSGVKSGHLAHGPHIRLRLLKLRQFDCLLDHAFFRGGQAHLEFM